MEIFMQQNMKRFISAFSYLLGALLLVSLAQSAEAAEDVKLFSVPFGSKAEQLGYKPHSLEKECNPSLGPTSFFVQDNGEIYVLDTVHQRLNVYNKSGKLMKNVSLPTRQYSEEFYMLDGFIYLLTEIGIEKISMSGQLEKSIFIFGEHSPLNNQARKLFNLAGMLIVSQGTSSNDKIACYQPQTLERKPCGKIESLFKKYEIVESTGHEAVIGVGGGGNLALLDLDNNEITTFVGKSPYGTVDQGFFDMVTFFRIANGKLYTMVPSKTQASFYARSIH
jgi:hypothetical protein